MAITITKKSILVATSDSRGVLFHEEKRMTVPNVSSIEPEKKDKIDEESIKKYYLTKGIYNGGKSIGRKRDILKKKTEERMLNTLNFKFHVTKDQLESFGWKNEEQ